MPVDPTAVVAILAVFSSGTLIFRPLAKALARRIGGAHAVGTSAADAERICILEAALQDAALRLSATEHELSRTAEKVEFMEKLLNGPATPSALPPRRAAAMV
jgi:hypothetical protein